MILHSLTKIDFRQENDSSLAPDLRNLCQDRGHITPAYVRLPLAHHDNPMMKVPMPVLTMVAEAAVVAAQGFGGHIGLWALANGW